MSGCPRHGNEFLKKDGNVTYCAAPTPEDTFDDICMWHAGKGTGKIKEDPIKEKKYKSIKLTNGLEIVDNAAGLEMARNWNYHITSAEAKHKIYKRSKAVTE
jgi:hypothetical protein